jgi:hypothetical protein
MFWLIELAFIVVVFGGLALLVWVKSKQLNKNK